MSIQYGIPDLCALSYTIALNADATTFGVSILFNTPNYYIRILTTNQTLIGQTINLTLTANVTALQQDSTPPSLPF